MLQTTIIVPCYNEAERLDQRAFLDAVHQRPWLTLLLVDDGSKDDTRRVLSSLAEQAPGRIDVLGLDQNQGKAEAVRRGMLHAFDREPSSEVLGYWDADLATPFEELDGMVRTLEQQGLLILFASRVALLGRDVQRAMLRHYVGRVFATMASVAVGLPVYDTQCGAKVFRREPVVKDLFLSRFHSRWTFDVELLERLVRYDRAHGTRYATERIAEYPLGRWHDIRGSKVKMLDGVKAAYDLLAVAARVRRP